MTETKKILLIGRSGRGKSTLANVLLNKNDSFEEVFKESSSSVSETKKIQFEQFPVDDINYLVIDTPGIGDTKMSDSDVLDIIAEAVYLAKDGLSQVLFVVGGRFDQSEMATYNLLRTIIFDKDITKHTTIARTRFVDFRSKKKRQADINLMIKESQAKKDELKKKIADNEEKMENLSSDSEEYKKIVKETGQLNKELKSTLSEIIESCQSRIVHIDNPEDKDIRGKSRGKLLDHLSKSCQEDYNPEKLKELSKDIAEDYFQYLEKKRKLAEELRNLKVHSKSSADSQLLEIENTSKESNKSESVVEEEKKISGVDQESKVEVDDLAVGEKTKHWEDIKEKLEREIKEKEKIIRQKVLKHIFNNIDNISDELGGDIFMESVVGEHNWEKISPEFNDKKLVVKWLSKEFDYEQVQKWAIALGNSFKPTDVGFCAWLRDDKKLTVEKIRELDYPRDIEQLKEEYCSKVREEVSILSKYGEQLDQENWKEIHKDFSDYYQKEWKERGFTYEQAKQWISIGFTPDESDFNVVWWLINIKNQSFDPNLNVEKTREEYEEYLKTLYQEWGNIHEDFESGNVFTWLRKGFNYQETKLLIDSGFIPGDYDKAKQWKDQGFGAEEVQQWLNKGLNKNSANLAKFLLNKGYTSTSFPNDGQLTELKEEYLKDTNDWSVIHEDFADYQKSWEEANIVLQETQEWIQAGFKPNEYNLVKAWKSHNFTLQEVKSWIEVGLTKNDYEYTDYLRWKNIQLGLDLDLEQLREEFNAWEKEEKPAQEFLDILYPQGQRKEITVLNIGNKNLQGELDLSDFVNLEELYCQSNNKITSLNLNNCSKLRILYCYYTQLVNLDIDNCNELGKIECSDNHLQNIKLPSQGGKLTWLNISDNNFLEQDLSSFSNLVNLETLWIHNENNSSQERQGITNRFYGSLEPLKNLTKLRYLDVKNTDIDSGLEYLPDSLKIFNCSTDYRKDAKCQNVYNLLVSEEIGDGYHSMNSQKLKEYKQKFQEQSQQQAQIQIPPK